jgi:hypothetical protein
MTQGREIAEELGHAVDVVVDSGDCGTEPTTVIDFSWLPKSSISCCRPGPPRNGPHAVSVICCVLAIPCGGDHAPVVFGGHEVVVDSSCHRGPHLR